MTKDSPSVRRKVRLKHPHDAKLANQILSAAAKLNDWVIMFIPLAVMYSLTSCLKQPNDPKKVQW